MHCVYDLRIIRTNTDRVQPPDETLQQDQNPDRGFLDSSSPLTPILKIPAITLSSSRIPCIIVGYVTYL